MNDPTITLPDARVALEPELKQTKTGRDYLSITLAANGRVKNKTTGEWEDTPTFWAHVSEFDTGMIAAYQQTLQKGTRVRAEGILQWRSALDKNGQPITYFDLKFPHLTVIVPKVKDPDAANQPTGFQPAQPPASFAAQASQPHDPWSMDGFDAEPSF